MAVPKVNLRQIQCKTGITYVLDYTVDGRRVCCGDGSDAHP